MVKLVVQGRSSQLLPAIQPATSNQQPATSIFFRLFLEACGLKLATSFLLLRVAFSYDLRSSNLPGKVCE
jgi:hypothetical protein